MKYLPILFFLLLTLISCSVEQRIKEYSYTDEWYYVNTAKFQVYKTRTNRKYIIVLNKKQTKYKRKYIKL
jgi:hypothetical protein